MSQNPNTTIERKKIEDQLMSLRQQQAQVAGAIAICEYLLTPEQVKQEISSEVSPIA